MEKHERTLAIAMETLGCCVVAAGIAVEVSTGAEVGFIIITSGSLLALVGAIFFAKIFRKQ